MKTNILYLLIALLIMAPIILWGVNISIEAFNQLVQPSENLKIISVQTIEKNYYILSFLGTERKIPSKQGVVNFLEKYGSYGIDMVKIYGHNLHNFLLNKAGDCKMIVEKKISFFKIKFMEEKEKMEKYWQEI